MQTSENSSNKTGIARTVLLVAVVAVVGVLLIVVIALFAQPKPGDASTVASTTPGATTTTGGTAGAGGTTESVGPSGAGATAEAVGSHSGSAAQSTGSSTAPANPSETSSPPLTPSANTTGSQHEGPSSATATSGSASIASDSSSGNTASQTASGGRGSSSLPAGYTIPVGASPLDTRAQNPVDLYMPNPDPAFDITTQTAFPPTDSENVYVQWMLAHTDQQEKYLRERWQRATIALERHHITRKRVLEAFLMTPREWFVRPYNLDKTYTNSALPIGYGQTISGPDLVARMTDYLDPQPGDKVLEIGTGSGYQSAFLSSLSNYVYTIEIVKPLAEETNQIYLDHTKELPQLGNIHRRMADGYYGWPEAAPFDKIIVTTGTDHIPPDLLKELKPDGVMIIPVGPPTGQTILKVTKTVDANGDVHLAREDIYHGTAKDIFVPFTAASGGTHSLAD